MKMKHERSIKQAKFAVLGIILLYVVFASAWAFTERLKYGPDEPAHFIYVRSIGSHFRIPVLSHEETPHAEAWDFEKTARRQPLSASHEAHQPPLYYAIAAVPYVIASSLNADTDTTWRVVRLANVLIGAIWVYFLYRLLRELFGERRFAAAAGAGFVGLLPMSAYIGGVVNNDALVCALFTAAMWLVIKAFRQDRLDVGSTIIIGIFCGLTALAKSQGFLLFPVVLLAAFFISRRSNYENLARALLWALGTLGAASLVVSPWLIRNVIAVGALIPQSLHKPAPLVPIWFLTDQLFKYFWTPFWLIRDVVNEWGYLELTALFCAVVFLGLILHFVNCRKQKSKELLCRAEVWVLMAAPAVLIYVFLLRHTLLVDVGALQQGRLMLPSAGFVGMSVVLGFDSLTARNTMLKITAAAATGAALIAANIMIMRAVP